MADKQKNTIVVLEPNTKSAMELVKLVEEKGLADIIRVPTVEEAIQTLAQSLPCILVASINDNQDVPTRVQLFKRLEGAIKQQGLKVFVVTPLKNRQLSDMVTQKLGVADYIVEPVPIRTMQFKINLQLKAIDNFRRQQEIKRAAAEAVVIKKLDANKKAETAMGGEVKANGKPALQAGEDTFLFKNSGVKKTGKKFTVELEGPAPETGEWVPHEDKGDPTPAWRWVPNEEKEKQASGELPADGWVHKGDKPQFNEETNKWAMTSEKPSLGLRKKGKLEAEKVGVDEAGEVFVAEDSPAAVENVLKNRAKAARLKPKGEKKSLKDALKEEEAAPKDPGEPATEEEETDPVTKAIRAKMRPKKNQLDGLKNLLGKGVPEASAGELHDQRSPEAGEEAHQLRDQRADGEEGETKFNALKEGEEAEQDLPGAPRRKIKLAKDELRAETTRLEGEPLPEGVNPLEESGEEEDASPEMRSLKRKKKKAKLGDHLERLKQGLGEDEGPDEDSDDLSAEEEDEEEQRLRGRPALKVKGKSTEHEDPEKLRDDPADERGELRDLQQLKSKRKEKLRNERKRTVAEMQALLESPIEEEMSPEEEEALREEFGLKGRPEIKVRDLARRKRLKNAKKLKAKLGELDFELAAEEEGETHSSGVSRGDGEEAAARREHDLAAEKLKGIRGAIDNGLTAEELEEERKRLKAKHEAERKLIANKDRAIYIPEAEIQPLGNAWESSGTHYAYLASTVRYKGFGKLEDLLPLWYFEGDDVPQLLDKTKQWRFLGGRPVRATTVVEIPAALREFLIALRDQLKQAGALSKEDAERAESEEDLTAHKKSKDEAARDKLRSLADELGDDEESEKASGQEGEDLTGGKRPKHAEEGALSFDKPEREDGEEEELSKFDRLKAMLSDDADGDPGADEAGEEAAETETEGGEDAMARLRAKLIGAEDSISDKLAAAPGLQSDGVQKFLEKRKKKAEVEALSEAIPAPAAARAPAPGFLGVFVALSDAYSHRGGDALPLCRVLASMEDSFKKCIVYCTSLPDASGMAEVRYHSPNSPAPTEKIALSGGLSEPVQSTAGGKSEVLGYLFMGAVGERTSFTDAEELTFRNLAGKIWPLMRQAERQKTEKDAA